MTMFVGLSWLSLLSQHSGRCPGARLTSRIEGSEIPTGPLPLQFERRLLRLTATGKPQPRQPLQWSCLRRPDCVYLIFDPRSCTAGPKV